MELSKNNYIVESIDIKETKFINKAILFTDMVDSSNLWKNNPKETIKAIEKHSFVIDEHVKKNKGIIIKTIGDAHMISFGNIKDAIQCGIDIQESLKNKPINITKTKGIELRIGICYGPVYDATIDIQNKKLVDYFGNTVNTASRIESMVSEVGDIAFAITADADKVNLDEFLEDRKAELISFKNKGEEIKRSNRILTDIHRHIYKNVEELKGVEEIDVYKIKI